LHGTTAEWYLNGEKKEESTWYNGELTGPFREWYPNSQKKVEGSYLQEVKQGRWTYWNDKGQVIKQEQFEGGVPDGYWMTIDNKGSKEEGNYAKGTKQGAWTKWYSNGQKWESGLFEGGQETGKWTTWHDTGAIKAEGLFRDGKQTGMWTFWHQNGNKLTECEYQDGKVVGLWPSWNDKGEMTHLLKTLDLSEAFPGLIGKVPGAVRSVTFSPDGSVVAAAVSIGVSLSTGNDGRVYAWSTKTGDEVWVLNHPLEIHSLCFSPDGAILATTSGHTYPTNLHVWQVDKRKLVKTITRSGARFSSLFFMTDGRLASVVNSENKHAVCVWNIDTAQEEELLRSNQTIYCADLSRDGQTLVYGSRDDTLRLWDTAAQTNVRTIKLEAGQGGGVVAVWGVEFAPDGKTLAVVVGRELLMGGSVSGSSVLKLFDTTGWTERRSSKLEGSFAFGPNNNLAASVIDKRLSILNTETGRVQTALNGPQSTISSLAFSPDSRLLAAGTQNSHVEIWAVPQAEQALQSDKGPAAAVSKKNPALETGSQAVVGSGSKNKLNTDQGNSIRINLGKGVKAGTGESRVHAGILPFESSGQDCNLTCVSGGHSMVIEVWSGNVTPEQTTWWEKHTLVDSSDGRPKNGGTALITKDPTMRWTGRKGPFTLLFVHWPRRCGCNQENIDVTVDVRGTMRWTPKTGQEVKI
jgi:WD40 repeat protein